MKFDDILERLDHKTRQRLAAASLYIPRQARGHGGITKQPPKEAGYTVPLKCNAVGCNMGDRHTQERMEVAYELMYGK